MIETKDSKSQPITKTMVWKAYQKVRANGGSAGIDAVSLKEFEKDKASNLYKLWNRMASGSYFPPAVMEVAIPKATGGVRKLGIPTVADRVAQMVVKDVIEPEIDKVFDASSFGYRPKKSAHQALDQARKNCWKYAWVIDLDIKGYFDTIDHDLLLKAVRKHISEKWIIMYIERWLKAPVQRKDGKEERAVGTPQGCVVSPLLANLFLHYVFDKWMRKYFPGIEFERYADDIIVHCKTQMEAEKLLLLIKGRMEACKLTLHPEKTQIIHCYQKGRKKEKHPCKFTFLGFSFQPRTNRDKEGRKWIGFDLGVSIKAKKKMYEKLRELAIHRMTGSTIVDLAKLLNPIMRGWIQYFGRYRKSLLTVVLFRLNQQLIRWAVNRHKRFGRSTRKALVWWRGICRACPTMFVHWKFGVAFK